MQTVRSNQTLIQITEHGLDHSRSEVEHLIDDALMGTISLAPFNDLEVCVCVCLFLSPLLGAIPVCADCGTQVLT